MNEREQQLGVRITREALEQEYQRGYKAARAALSTPQADKVPAAEGASREPSDADYRRWAGSSGAHLREDYDQSTPYAIFHNATQWMNFCETVRSVHRELATPPAKVPQEAQPVEFSMMRGTCTISGPKEDVLFISALIGEPDAAPQPARVGAVELSRAQINDAMRDAGWQNRSLRQADLDKVEKVVRWALAAATTAATGGKSSVLIPGYVYDRRGKEPCGECHIQPGETCDICGAAAATGKKEQS